jgi:hypothetical protein
MAEVAGYRSTVDSKQFPVKGKAFLLGRISFLEKSLEIFYASVKRRVCSETMLTGESRFNTNTPLGIEPRSLMTGSKRVVDQCV